MQEALKWLARAGGTIAAAYLTAASVMFLITWHMLSRMSQGHNTPGFGFYFMLLVFLPFAGFAAAVLVRAAQRICTTEGGGRAAMAAWGTIFLFFLIQVEFAGEVFTEPRIIFPVLIGLALMRFGGRIAGGIIQGFWEYPVYYREDGTPDSSEAPREGIIWALGTGLVVVVMLWLSTAVMTLSSVQAAPWLVNNPVVFLFLTRVLAGWTGLRFARCPAWRIPALKAAGVGAAIVSIEGGFWLVWLTTGQFPIPFSAIIPGLLPEFLAIVAGGALGGWLGTLGPMARADEDLVDDGDGFQLDYEGPAPAGAGFGSPAAQPASGRYRSNPDFGPVGRDLSWDAAGSPQGEDNPAPVGGTLGIQQASRRVDAESGQPPKPALDPVDKGKPLDDGEPRRRPTDMSSLADMYQTFDGGSGAHKAVDGPEQE